MARAVRHAVRYRLSSADVVAWLAERGLIVHRSTMYRWVQRFLPLCGEAARAYRRGVGKQWRVDELDTRLGGTWTYLERAIDQHGQVVAVSCSKRRNAAAADAFFERAIAVTGSPPTRVTSDKAKCSPPALRTVLPNVAHRTSNYRTNGIERDHGHRTQRLRPMRSFGYPGGEAISADVLARGHARVQNLRTGFSTLTAHIPRPLRLAAAWPQLTQVI
jgi:transposase-like protein